MEVTNYSDRAHRYREPGSQGDLYYWGPGESKEVPDSIGLLMRRVHPDKFAQGAPESYTTTSMSAPVATVLTSQCAGFTKLGASCKRKVGADGYCSAHRSN